MNRYEWDKRIEKMAAWIAWHLPRRVVMWCYVRVAVAGFDGNPATQTVDEPLKRWEIA